MDSSALLSKLQTCNKLNTKKGPNSKARTLMKSEENLSCWLSYQAADRLGH